MDVKKQKADIELLAPVGTMEALKAAVYAGADAVYLAGQQFGARAQANFTDDDLYQAIMFAHKHNVAVYIAVNTLIKETEISELTRYIEKINNWRPDAIIIQDLATLAICRRVAKSLPIHASTQMSIHNADGVRMAAQFGISRVILARELSLHDIASAVKAGSECGVEIEVFVHGALCYAYSGQCLMSSLIGGRSGNRGRCAQPCRMPYQLLHNGYEKKDLQFGEYLLSPCDMNSIERLSELMDCGVKALKIEGRMKRPEYVATVVEAYRSVLDDIILNVSTPAEQIHKINDKMAQIFNRGFTSAYLDDQVNSSMMSHQRPNNRGVMIGRVIDSKGNTIKAQFNRDVHIGDIIEIWTKIGGRINLTLAKNATAGVAIDMQHVNKIKARANIGDRIFRVYDAQLEHEAQSYFSFISKERMPRVKLKATLNTGNPLEIKLIDNIGNEVVQVSDQNAEVAVKNPLTNERLCRQLAKDGDVNYNLVNVDVKTDGRSFLALSVINQTRRLAFEQLDSVRLSNYTQLENKFVIPEKIIVKNEWQKLLIDKKLQKRYIIARVDSLQAAQAAVFGRVDMLSISAENFTAIDGRHDLIKYKEMAERSGVKLRLETPRVVRNDEENVVWQKTLEIWNDLSPDAILVRGLAALPMINNYDSLRRSQWHADFTLNVYNSVAANYLFNLGFEGITLAQELNLTEIRQALNDTHNIWWEIVVHGYQPLMVAEYCPIGGYNKREKKCNLCRTGQWSLQDRKGEKFSLRGDHNCRINIFNSKMLYMADRISEIPSEISGLRLDCTNILEKQITDLVNIYRQAEITKVLPAAPSDITRGHFYRGVE